MQLSTLLTLLAAAASVAIAAPFHHHAQVNIQIDLTMEQATAVHSKQPPVTDLSNVAGHSDDHFRDLNFDFRLLASPLYSEDGLYQQLGFEGGKGVLKLGPDTIFRLKNGRLVAYDEKIVGYIEDDEHFPPRAVLVPKIVDRSPAGIEFKAVLDRGAVIYLLFDDGKSDCHPPLSAREKTSMRPGERFLQWA